MPQLIAPVFSSLGLGTVAAGIASELTASLLLSAASAALTGGSGSSLDTIRQLQIPTSLPVKRWCYGRTRVYGTWAPGWVVNNGILYGCLILNSRPSDGGDLGIWIDKREVTLSGDAFDFSAGAVAANSPFVDHAKFWVGLGDQSGPPDQIMSEWGDATGSDPQKFWPTDGWSGLTVMWVRLDRGGSSSRLERWPRTPPEIEVRMRWSKVWDPRNNAMDAADADTWAWSRNQALCLLDALRTNPVRGRSIDQIDLPSFVDAADIADEAVPLAAGGSEPRYQADGLIAWAGGEVADQLSPLVLAGGGELYRAGGKVGYAAGAYRGPMATISNVLDGQPFKFTRLVPGRDIPRAVVVSFVNPDAEYEMSSLPAYEVPGGGGYTGGDDGVTQIELQMVQGIGQAARLQKRAALRAGGQKRLSAEMPPTAFDVIAGSTVEIELPRSGDARNGLYEVVQVYPGRWLEDGEGGGVALRLPMDLRELVPEADDWTTDEEVVLPDSNFVPLDLTLAPPTDLTATFYGDRIGFSFLRGSLDAASFEWEWQKDAGGWQSGGTINAELADGSGELSGTLVSVTAGSWLIRVRAVAPGRSSVWLALESPVVVTLDLDPPIPGAATGGAGEIDFTFTAPNSIDFRGMEIFAGDTSDVADASSLTTVYGSANATFSFTETGLGAAVTRYYFARSLGPAPAVTGFSAALSATTDP